MVKVKSEKRFLLEKPDHTTLKTVKKGIISQKLIMTKDQTLIESSILAQDERWRRA